MAPAQGIARTVIAFQRFGLGQRPGDVAAARGDATDLLLTEIAAGRLPQPSGLEFTSTAEIGPAFFRAFEENRARNAASPPKSKDGGGDAMAAAAPGGEPTMAARPNAAAREAALNLPSRLYRAEAKAVTDLQLGAVPGFGERLVQFWSNHFCIAANKNAMVRSLAGAYEREAIRPHVLGRFEDMLQAAESHPAMLIYLDNQLSIGPNSRAGARRGRGLNENLAREILELHTLGVDGGYSQADVTAFARALTGWTVVAASGNLGTPGSFVFNGNLHEPGAQTILGRSFADGGIEQGRRVLSALARHPSTARHVARKLAAHFVADTPPPALVQRLAETFRKTEGDLAAVSRVLIESPEAWEPELRKVRSPREFMLAAARALGREPEIGQILQPLATMGQPLWQPGGPNGFPDTVDAWVGAEGLKTRIDIASNWGRQAADKAGDPRALLTDLLGPLASSETREAVARAESRQQALAILLMSPEFQRR